MSQAWNGSLSMNAGNESMHIPLNGRSERRSPRTCESCERKDKFMAIVSHELRNMLAPIAMALDACSKSDADRPDPELLEIARSHSHQLSRLIDDLFDACRLSSGKVQLQREMIDLRDIAMRSIQAVNPTIKKRRQDLLVTLCDEPVPLYADPMRIEQVCLNLLNNAAKYTPEGGCIWLQLRREYKAAVFEVRDSGCGIKPEVMPHLFDFFSQDGETHGRTTSGLGIGLAITKSLVETHGGIIEVHSDGPGCGADFTVTLPCTH